MLVYIDSVVVITTSCECRLYESHDTRYYYLLANMDKALGCTVCNNAADRQLFMSLKVPVIALCFLILKFQVHDFILYRLICVRSDLED